MLRILSLINDYSPPRPNLFKPFLSGKKLFNTQTFRNLFRLETSGKTKIIGVKEITILFTDLKGSVALYDRIGDLKAFSLVHQHFESLGRIVNRNSGAIVKTIGDAIMVAFLDAIDAVKTALLMLDEIERFNQKQGERELILKIGINKGAAIAVTLNDRLDYFGQTINIASRMERLADADEIYFTHDVYNCPRVREFLKGFEIAPAKARLKGIQEEAQVYKINRNVKIQ